MRCITSNSAVFKYFRSMLLESADRQRNVSETTSTSSAAFFFRPCLVLPLNQKRVPLVRRVFDVKTKIPKPHKKKTVESIQMVVTFVFSIEKTG